MTGDRYEADEDKLQQVFDAYIADLVFGDTDPVRGEKPTVVMLGGQLAAGKSTALTSIVERHQGTVAPVSPDKFRPFHPYYDEIKRDHPHELMAFTSEAMYRFSEMTRTYAHAHGYGMVIEGTFGNPPGPVAIVEQLAQRPEPPVHEGFRAEAVGIAVSEYRSRLDMVGRYLAQPPGRGRWTDAEHHDRIYRMVPRTLDALEASPHVDRVIVTDRSGATHYDNTRDESGGAWAHEPHAGAALKHARSDGAVPFDRPEATEWMTSYWQHAERLLDRRELNPVTAPTMLALHADADLVAPIAHAGDQGALAQHERWQVVQKAVFQAGQQGVDNTSLPRTPNAYLAADAEQRARFIAALASGVPTGKREEHPVDPVAEDAVRRAQQGTHPPGRREAAPEDRRPRNRPGPDPGLER